MWKVLRDWYHYRVARARLSLMPEQKQRVVRAALKVDAENGYERNRTVP